MASGSNSSTYELLEKVTGYENRKNDILLFPNDGQTSPKSIVYYFGGDIQVTLFCVILTYRIQILINC